MYPIKNEESTENIPLGKKPKLSSKEVGIVSFVKAECFFDLNEKMLILRLFNKFLYNVESVLITIWSKILLFLNF